MWDVYSVCRVCVCVRGHMDPCVPELDLRRTGNYINRGKQGNTAQAPRGHMDAEIWTPTLGLTEGSAWDLEKAAIW